MKKLHIVGFAFGVMFAFCVFNAASAFAATEWLFNNESITVPLSGEATGEVLLEDMSSLLKVDILCSGISDGTVGPKAAGEITKLLNLSKVEETATNLAGKVVPAFNCELMEKGGCEEANGSLIFLFPLHLPWKTELLLPTTTLWVGDLKEGTGGEPGYEMSCKNPLLGTVTDVCTGKPGATLTNETGGVLGRGESDETNNPPGNCSIGGEKQGLVEGEALGVHSTGGTLSVS